MFLESLRAKDLNNNKYNDGDFVLYLMQYSHRVDSNFTLEYSIDLANRLNNTLIAAFNLNQKNHINAMSHRFLLEGISRVANALETRGIQSFLIDTNFEEVLKKHGKQISAIVCEKRYTRNQKKIIQEIASKARCRVIQVEDDVVVPIDLISKKSEHGVRTFRPKIQLYLKDFLKTPQRKILKKESITVDVFGSFTEDFKNDQKLEIIKKIIKGKNNVYVGGSHYGEKYFRFLIRSFNKYDGTLFRLNYRDIYSIIDCYINHGQLSTLKICLESLNLNSINYIQKKQILDKFIIKREFCINFVNYTNNYDSYSILPNWCKETLKRHKNDIRTNIYEKDQLQSASTHDPFWNAAMNEIKLTGCMNSYMCSYWAKKILEWSLDPEESFHTAYELYQMYSLDSDSPVRICHLAHAFGFQDCPTKDKPIYGTVRSISAMTLKNRIDIEKYVSEWGS